MFSTGASLTPLVLDKHMLDLQNKVIKSKETCRIILLCYSLDLFGNNQIVFRSANEPYEPR